MKKIIEAIRNWFQKQVDIYKAKQVIKKFQGGKK